MTHYDCVITFTGTGYGMGTPNFLVTVVWKCAPKGTGGSLGGGKGGGWECEWDGTGCQSS